MYLSSFRLGDHPERLIALLTDPSGPAAIIANACDGYPADGRVEGVQREIDALRGLGIEARVLDLRDYFGQRERLASELPRYRMVWVRGGNTFVLRHAMAASGADAILTELIRRDAIVYSGYSAGACVLAPSLRGLETEGLDDPDLVRSVYGAPGPIWAGLGLLDYMILPHFESPGHPETEAVGRAVDRFRAEGLPHRTLRDGQAIVIDGASTVVA
jgi:dipeptidase E